MQHLGLAANLKIEMVAELLERHDHRIDVLSQGEVAEEEARFFSAFREEKPFSSTVRVMYASALPVRRINGLWSAFWTLRLFKQLHRREPYDVVIVYNLKLPQIVCARHAIRRLGLPVVLEYEDDAVVDVRGRSEAGRSGSWQFPLVQSVLDSVSACLAVSPHLLSRVSADVPKSLLRGVVSENILQSTRETTPTRKNWVVFSGTHAKVKGLEQLVSAWEMAKLRDWELHIAGHGDITDLLKKMTQHDRSIHFHGLLNREDNARLLRMSRIGINPHDLSQTPGNVFAFKIIEYLAAGTHVITTPMGPLEEELEAGITYIPDNTPQTIAAALTSVIAEQGYDRLATEAAQQTYGQAAVARMLNKVLEQVRTPAAAGL
jgi:glycosyltransferase involved in cell wall biosynthesis